MAGAVIENNELPWYMDAVQAIHVCSIIHKRGEF
jgi:hypothetical protein